MHMPIAKQPRPKTPSNYPKTENPMTRQRNKTVLLPSQSPRQESPITKISLPKTKQKSLGRNQHGTLQTRKSSKNLTGANPRAKMIAMRACETSGAPSSSQIDAMPSAQWQIQIHKREMISGNSAQATRDSRNKKRRE